MDKEKVVSVERPAPRIAGNTATGTLKIIALVFMFIDHSGKMLFNNAPLMRTLGRVAFPLYCWCLVVGFCYTRSPLKYLLRVLTVGLISQPLYMAALNHSWNEPNVFLTLALALCALWGIRERWYFSQVWAPLVALILAVELRVDYGWRGVALVMMLYAAREKRGAIASVMIAMALFWGSASSTLRLPGLDFSFLLSWRYRELTQPFLKLQTMMLLSLPLILIPLRKNVKLPTWLGYAIYPLHLLVLWGVEQLV